MPHKGLCSLNKVTHAERLVPGRSCPPSLLWPPRRSVSTVLVVEQPGGRARCVVGL